MTLDQFRDARGVRPSVEPICPEVQINVHIFRNRATLSLDLSGESLHRRGYRQEQLQAPLKETLAAALLMTAGWPGDGSLAFVDPMCGSGTLPIEAAMMAGNIAPGLYREYFGFLRWLGHDDGLWTQLKAEAESQIRYKPETKFSKILGYDHDPRAIATSIANRDRIPLLLNKVHFEKRELGAYEAPSERGILIVNPPYGDRLGELEALKILYKELGDVFKKKFKGWDAFVFTGSPDLAKSVGLKCTRRHIFFNGPIECRLLHFPLY
jgi:23S rRNA (guanine2445-N2)-methyltransferase / 23S rRNA (guanine2069-N7)-methyltransferase